MSSKVICVRPERNLAMTIFRIAGICLPLIVFGHIVSLGQDESRKTPDQSATKSSTSKTRQVWIKLNTGEVVKGDLLKVDTDTVEFKVLDILQSVSLDKVSNISFVDPSNRPSIAPSRPENRSGQQSGPVEPMSNFLKPTITYKEKARYTREARDNQIEGIVVLNVVFTAEGRITSIRVVRGLPHGLTEKAIEAAQKIRFEPATRDGKPISVRGNLEFSFQLGN
jgi:TonB family protein